VASDQIGSAEALCVSPGERPGVECRGGVGISCVELVPGNRGQRDRRSPCLTATTVPDGSRTLAETLPSFATAESPRPSPPASSRRRNVASMSSRRRNRAGAREHRGRAPSRAAANLDREARGGVSAEIEPADVGVESSSGVWIDRAKVVATGHTGIHRLPPRLSRRPRRDLRPRVAPRTKQALERRRAERPVAQPQRSQSNLCGRRFSRSSTFSTKSATSGTE
jgi:hypothetical protein